MTKRYVLSLAVAALTAGSAAAQQQQRIVPGEVTRGTLSTSDPRDQGKHYDDYVFAGRRGETVIVNMESRAFDTYVYLGTLRRGVFQQIGGDDDGGNGTNSRLEVRLPEDGNYVIRATALGASTGAYTLTLSGGRATSDNPGWEEPRPDPVYDRPGTDYDARNGGPIVAGDRVRGRLASSDPSLDNGAAYHLYTYQGRRGERVTMTLRSTDFDAMLVLGTRGGRHGVGTVLTRDDDSGGGRDARIDFTLPNDGEFVVRVNPLMPSNGSYTLEVESSLGGRPRPDPVYDRPGTGYEARNGGPIVAGDRVRGQLASSDLSLENGAAYHLYTYQGRRGERVTMTLRSTDFDAMLVLGTRGGRHGVGTVLTRDDDSGGGRDARIDFTLPNDGEFVVRVNPLMPSNGSYTLEVESSLGGRPRPDPVYDDQDEELDEDVVDEQLVGRWGLTSPTARVDSEDWNSVTANASLGILNITDSGAYTWRKSGRVLRGQLLPFTPRRNAQPGTQYYAINDGRTEYYIFFTEYRGERFMQMNARRTDAVVAYGYREGGTY